MMCNSFRYIEYKEEYRKLFQPVFHPTNYQITYFVAVLNMTSTIDSGGAKRCQSTLMLLGAHERDDREACITIYQHLWFENLTTAQMAFLEFSIERIVP